ncbi:unnamed protein product [Cuscuta campestris]|uniref:Replication factor A C-terminal domain-containing protein n=1 Tax=Cuscuta campestris TaxID=132261 RepID=A0A484LVT2_9ASTE|nr:unnamed protein product [Cuscuta campestris]
MEITLEDHEGNRLACTLWGEYVEKFLNCVTQGVPGPFILLLSFCKPRRYQGTVTVSTSFHVTKMIFDGNSDEVNQFRNSLPLQVDDISYSMEKNVAKSQIKAQFEKKRSNLGRSPNPTLMKLAQPPLFIPIQRKRENEVSVSKSMSSVDQIQDAPTTLLLLRSSLNAATERNSQREERLGL